MFIFFNVVVILCFAFSWLANGDISRLYDRIDKYADARWVTSGVVLALMPLVYNALMALMAVMTNGMTTSTSAAPGDVLSAVQLGTEQMAAALLGIFNVLSILCILVAIMVKQREKRLSSRQ